MRQLGPLAIARFKHRARGLFQRDSTRQATAGRVSPVPDLEDEVRERHFLCRPIGPVGSAGR